MQFQKTFISKILLKFEGLHNCDATHVCTNTDGSFVCRCGSGFLLVGETCMDINECTDGTHQCADGTDCTNEEGNCFQ